MGHMLSAPALEKPNRIPHLPALDGLRGLAVLSVLCFHAGAFLPGGYLGVDLFFVLSGFLITSLLLAEHAATGTVELSAFWARRARRLFPALLLLLPFVALYAALFARWTELARLRRSALATLAYVANWVEIDASSSYWDLFAVPSPLEHTWSLAIEEQFYIVWPLLVIGLFSVSKRRARTLFASCVVLAIASAVAMVHFYETEGGMRAYYGTDTRGAAILVGAALAALLAPLRPFQSHRAIRVLDVLGAMAAIGIAYAWRTLDGQNPFLYRGGFWLTELAALVLITCTLQGQRSWVARALAFEPLRMVGNVSYGVYLWHWPVFVVLSSERTHLDSPLALASLRFLVTFLIAGASYRFVEQPIRKGALSHPLRALVASVAVVVAITLFATRERPAVAETGSAKITQDARSMPPAADLPPQTLRLLFLGDSVARSLGETAREVQAQHQAFVAVRGRDDCSILEGVVKTKSLLNKPHASGNCAQDWAADVAELKPDATLVVLGGGFFAPASVKEKWYLPCERAWLSVYLPQLTRRIRELRPLGGQVFLARVADPTGGWQRPKLNTEIDCFNQVIDEAARLTGATVVDLQSRLCPEHKCALQSQGAPIRPDGMHFAGPGARDTVSWLLKSVRSEMR